MQISTLIETVAVLMALMIIGYFGAKKGIFTPTVTKGFSSLVFNVFLVSSVFSSICNDVPDMSAKDLLVIIGVLSLTVIMSYVIARVYTLIFTRKGDAAPITEMSIAVMNTLLFGLPIVQQVYGSMAVLYMGLSSVAFNLVLFSYGVMRLHKGEGSVIRFKDMLSPVLLATVLAVVFLLARIPLPGLLQRYLNMTAPATLPMSMMVLGATMGGGDLLGAFKDRRIYGVCFTRLVLAPLIMWAVLAPMGLEPILLRTAVVIAGCPTGVIIPVMALQYGHDALFASRCVMASTLMSVITLPILILLLG